jgi:molecular chaperone GrpE (heat shock protein)
MTLAASALLGAGLAWSPLAQAQSTGSATPPSAATGAPMSAPMAQAPRRAAPASSTARTDTVKPRSDAQVEAHITQLHKQLKITQDQESDWSKVAQDMRDGAQQMSSLIQERNETAKSKPMNAVDNLKNYAQIADAHADSLKKITPDFESLYDKMTPAQQKTADHLFNQRIGQRVRTTAAPSSKPRG